ncbi:GntR family transcriptional regulator [Bordetella sp. BOR01]|uniref:GntR family transcriptional regulator n=1 Tax=Bordetella sp. BOR01 TaxID=2854779 RepID=UPI001C492C0E|nr:GntR family transcriptional regulator [Bordetella sp. BOR01]MBV7483359.1 GntR family transcriptional regulator [Bordetella sp. BOR01]
MPKNASRPLPKIRLAGPDGLPKYLQLKNALAQEITAGRWEPGDQLPAEDLLVEAAGLSLGTVQRALRMLVDDGVLIRRHGSGTYVAKRRYPMGGPFQHFRFVDDTGEGILPIYTRVLRRFVVEKGGPWHDLLKSEKVVCIDREFSINNEFSVYVQIYFCGIRIPELASVDTAELNGVSFKDLLSRKYGQSKASYTERMSIRRLPPFVAQGLKLPRNTVGVRLDIVATDQNGNAIYFQHAYIPPNERQLLMQDH